MSQDLQPIPRARGRISDLVTQELTAAIRDLRLPPGSVLSETDLAARLAISRTPLREAFSRLIDHGLITVVPQVGTRVSLIDLREVEQAVFIRTALETAAFRDAASSLSRDVTELKRLLHRQEQAAAARDFDEFFEADEALHQEIFRLGGHPTVWSVVVNSRIQLDRLRRLAQPDVVDVESLIEEHRRIVDLLEAGDGPTGSAVVAQHAHRAIDLIPALLERHANFFASP